MCVSSEDSLVVHDVEGVSVVFVLLSNDLAAASVEALLVFLFILHHFGLCSLERLRHIAFRL